MRKFWSQKDISFLTQNYPKKGVDYCANNLNRTRNSIKTMANKLKIFYSDNLYDKIYKEKRLLIENHLKYEADQFKINNEFYAYLLGFIWGDGHISKKTAKNVRYYTSMSILYDDGLQICKILDRLKIKYWTGIENRNNYQKLLQIQIRDAGLNYFLYLNDYHIKSNKSPIKILNIIPKKYYYAFYLGLSDADGCWYIKNNVIQYSISGPYYYDWEFITNWFDNIGDITYGITRSNTKYGKCSIIRSSNKKSIIKIIQKMYKNPNLNGLLRKYAKIISILNRFS